MRLAMGEAGWEGGSCVVLVVVLVVVVSGGGVVSLVMVDVNLMFLKDDGGVTDSDCFQLRCTPYAEFNACMVIRRVWR